MKLPKKTKVRIKIDKEIDLQPSLNGKSLREFTRDAFKGSSKTKTIERDLYSYKATLKDLKEKGYTAELVKVDDLNEGWTLYKVFCDNNTSAIVKRDDLFYPISIGVLKLFNYKGKFDERDNK